MRRPRFYTVTSAHLSRRRWRRRRDIARRRRWRGLAWRGRWRHGTRRWWWRWWRAAGRSVRLEERTKARRRTSRRWGSTVTRSTIGTRSTHTSVLVVAITTISITSSCCRSSGSSRSPGSRTITSTVALIVGLTTTAAATSPRRRSGRATVASTTVVAVTRPRCRASSGTTLPWLEGALASTVVVSASSAVAVVFDRRARLATSASHLGHKCVELVLWGTANTSWLTAVAETVVVAPRLTDFAVGTIASHVTSLTTDTADDAGREVLLLWTIVLAMTNLTTVLAGLVLVVTKGTVEGGKLTKLVALEFVLAFRDRSSLQD